MPEEKTANLFLSYGRADAGELADRLGADLARHAAAGHPRYTVWKDRVEIRPGASWADQIAVALRKVEAVVAVMSPHSVRSRGDGRATDDSVCLDEISFARFGVQRPIVPVMAIQCTPPFEIFRLDYVDFTQWKSPGAYEAAFARLLDGIAAALRGEVRYRFWADRLQPWDYGNFLEEKRKGFVGRSWLFREIRTRLGAEGRKAILVVGGPGFGKSAFVGEYQHRNPDGRVIAFHCCQSTTRETLHPSRFVRSVAGMIASRHPAYEALLDQPPYRDVLAEKNCNADPESAFEEGVLAALERVGPPRSGRWVLLVDALDEATDAPAGAPAGIAQLLATRLARFPEWLSLVATTRPERSVLDLLAGLKPVLIDPSDLKNVRDLRRYVADRLEAPGLAAKLAAAGRKPAWAAKKIGDAAEGNFLYAEQALDALDQDLVAVQELGKLPPGLTRQYRLFFGRRFSEPAAWDSVKPILAMLIAAQAPLGGEDLAAGSGLDLPAGLPRRIAALGAYLRATADKPPRYAIFHKSLAEWLSGAEERGGSFAIDPGEGHRLLAEGLFARYEADRFRLEGYALTHLAHHLAVTARTDRTHRSLWQGRLAQFVLDRVIQSRRLEDPFGMDASLRLALDTVAGGPPSESAPLAVRLSLGLESFRRERLDASRIFRLARAGQLGQMEQELQLYGADEQWLNAARLVGAWLAADAGAAGATELRGRSRTHSVLDERVDAALEGRPAAFPALEGVPDLGTVTQILLQTGGSDAEGVNPSMVWDQAAPPPSGEPLDEQGTRYLAEFQAPPLVAFAEREPQLGTEKLREYVGLNAANAYRVYRNGSLWQILLAVARHRDPAWVREMAQPIIAAALAGAGREFGGASVIATHALRVVGDAGGRAGFDQLTQGALDATAGLAPLRGRGDSWGEHRRILAALAEARRVAFGESPNALLDRALGIPPGYAGFQAAACLTVAESLALCGSWARVGDALGEALRAAHNVQDLVFCARSVSRVHGLARIWWPKAKGDELAMVETVARFAGDPHAPEFAALHRVGEEYSHRRVVNPTSRLPAWLLGARTLQDLARAYQLPVSDWLKFNPAVPAPDAELPESDDAHPERDIRVPDPRFAPLLAAYFASRVLASGILKPLERAGLILRLVPVAVANRTALDTVLSRLVLAFGHPERKLLDEIDGALADYPLPASADVAGPEPVA